MRVVLKSGLHLVPYDAPLFQGEVYRHPISEPEAADAIRIGLVRFEPGGRTQWHTHTTEQSLIIVEGRGIVATDEGEHLVGPGDVIIIPPGEVHWHGGTMTDAMAHYSIALPHRTDIVAPVEVVLTKTGLHL